MVMLNKVVITVFLTGLCAAAQQSTDYLIVEAPIGTQSASKVLWVKWAGVSRHQTYPAPDSGTIYYDRSPGGGKLNNYRYSITTPYIDTSDTTKDSVWNNIYSSPNKEDPVAKRGIAFRAIDQQDMGFGVFYCVVALPMKNDTFVSNEFQIMVESPEPVDWVGPSGKITSMTPTFQWNANVGVPYYHIILSDDIIKIDSSSGEINLQGLSIIWQAITPATQMVYGAPDPSHTITADPPPLSPGQNYTWVVMNNYGNHMAFSSMKVKLPPGEFAITGTSLNKPQAIYPVSTNLKLIDNPKVVFKWKNLDAAANTYKLYVYIGSDFEGINAQLVVYQTEVVGSGRGGADEVDSVTIDAASVLTSNKYTWRVIAVNDQGAGTAGDTVGFHYEAPVGKMIIYTKEQIAVGSAGTINTVINPVGLTQLQVEVLQGSLEAPLLFYTDNNGYLSRERPAGAYRITAIKNGYENLSKTVVVKDGDSTIETFFLERPDATVYGKVLDASGKGINCAYVYGASDRGDTVGIKADAMGNFVLNCYAADWRIGVDMTGYESELPKKITIASAENYNFGTVVLQKNPFTLSGIVKNTSGGELLGVRVRLYKDGTLINEVPSTPQNGAFSFTVVAGTYTIIAEKTGFTSYNNSIDVMSSKSITAELEAGATLITGYIYGKTWVGESEVTAPITNAKALFIKDGSSDSVVVMSDPTYGDLKASLPGGKKYSLYSSAAGFVAKKDPVVFTTDIKATQVIYDTLQGLGVLSGIVTLSSDGAAVKRANISLVDLVSGMVVSSGESGVSGDFELHSIPDGSFFFSAGKDGLVLDSVGGQDTVTFFQGKADRTIARIYLEPGDKTIKWTTAGIGTIAASIKMQSPIVKTIAIGDSLTKSGPGQYIVSIDALSDSIIDLSYHRFFVDDTEICHIDTVDLHVVCSTGDTLQPLHGRVSLSLQSKSVLDSVVLYYKDAVATTYQTISDTSDDSSYTFEFIPPRDGSTMLYYLKGWRGSDIYGYDLEVHSVYILPDKSMFTRFEIVPSKENILSFPSKYDVPFQFKGYVSSVFIPDTTVASDGISWSLTDAQGSVLTTSGGTKTVVKTGSNKTMKPVVLNVTIDTAKINLAPGLKNSSMVKFNVSGSAIKSITIKRTDANNPNPISTSPTDNAEFTAQGYDEKGTLLDLFPAWTINPPDAGTINSLGKFKPKRNFAGIVRIFATVGAVNGEYRIDEQSPPGLNVRFMIVGRSSPDTAGNKAGCSVIFPPHVVNGNDIGLLEIGNANLKNQFTRGFNSIRTVDTLAFEIRQLENIALDFSADSIRLNLSVPKNMQQKVAEGKQRVEIAQWMEDSLIWKPLGNSRVAEDGKSVSAALTHFSRYCLVYKPSDRLTMAIAPNPFSPYIIPPYNPFNTDDKVPQQHGTCIKIQADIQEARTEVKLRIYTITGDMAWSFSMQNADNIPYYIWWDGHTSTRELQSEGTGHVVLPKNQSDKMCRNGRYFAVLTAKIKGKEQRVMKQMILMK